MKYLIIQLCDSSVSFCSYRASQNRNLIRLDVLDKALLWGVKKGLHIHILFPEYKLPKPYLDLICNYEHIEIKSLSDFDSADICVAKSFEEINKYNYISIPVIFQCSIKEFLSKYENVTEALSRVPRMNIIFNDVPNFSDNMISSYEEALSFIANKIFNSSFAS